MNESYWSRATLESRIADAGARRRHAGGSPDANEIAAYAAGLPRHSPGSAVGLGMTPELRALALAHFARVISVDINLESIALYRDWIAPDDRKRETILAGNWFEVPRVVGAPVSVVLADGVFGNLPDRDAHARLLGAIAAALESGGAFVTRMALIPDGFNAAEHRADRLLARFRAGELDEAEFGFGMRLVGHYESCYDARTCWLDNARLFAGCAARHAAGELSDNEWQAMRRYYYGGRNCIIAQREWEDMLARGGWSFQLRRCEGKAWYEYYPVYACRRKA